VETLDLGPGVKAIGMELIETESREPVRGKDAIAIWAGVFPALVAQSVVSISSATSSASVISAPVTNRFREAGAAASSCRNQATSSPRIDRAVRRRNLRIAHRQAVLIADTQLESASPTGLDAYQAAYTAILFVWCAN